MTKFHFTNDELAEIKQAISQDQCDGETLDNLFKHIHLLKEILHEVCARHEGYALGLGPCLCGPHEMARKLLGQPSGYPAKVAK